MNTHRGSRAGGVWPSFYDDEFRNNRAQPDRKRIQIAHMDTNGYVSLFVKRVSYPNFVTAIQNVLENEMRIARPATSWQSIRLDVPVIDVCLPLVPRQMH